VARIGNKTTSLGFVGASLIGCGPDGDVASSGTHTKPASYVMNKQSHTASGGGPMGQSIYDDTGRGM